MIERLFALLPFVAPPLLGAVIGYVTNAVAIRMLFRPLREFRVLRIRVPFTPGIIPRQRHELARNIGSMVAQRLLTEDIIRAQLSSDSVREGITRGIAAYTQRALHGVPEATTHDGPSRTARKLRPGLEHTVTTLIRGFLSSDELASIVGQSLNHAYDAVGELRIGSFFPAAEDLEAWVDAVLRRLPEGELWERIIEAASAAVAQELQADRPLGDYLGDQAEPRIQELLERSYAPVRRELLVRLQTPEIKRELSVRGKVLLRDILDKLSSWQRLLVSAGQYDRVLSERMPEIIDDLIDSLEEASGDEQNRERVIQMAMNGIRRLLDRGIADLCYEMSVNPMEWLVAVFEVGRKGLQDEERRNSLVQVVCSELDRVRELRVTELIEQVLEFEREEFIHALGQRLTEILRRDEVREKIAQGAVALVERFLDRARSKPLYELLALGQDDKAMLDDAIARRALALIEARLPEIIAVMDVEALVVRKIDQLDVENVERLLLLVIAKHLKWINVFGAILGAIIGGSQVLLIRFLL